VSKKPTPKLKKGNTRVGDKVQIDNGGTYQGKVVEVVRVEDDGSVIVKHPNGGNNMLRLKPKRGVAESQFKPVGATAKKPDPKPVAAPSLLGHRHKGIAVGRKKNVDGWEVYPVRGKHGDYGITNDSDDPANPKWYAYHKADETDVDGKYYKTPNDALDAIAQHEMDQSETQDNPVKKYGLTQAQADHVGDLDTAVRDWYWKMREEGDDHRTAIKATRELDNEGDNIDIAEYWKLRKDHGHHDAFQLALLDGTEPNAPSDDEVAKDILRRLRSGNRRGPGGPGKPVTVGELRKLSPSQRALIIEDLRRSHRSLGGSMSDNPDIGRRMREIGKLIDKIEASGPVKKG
jgi:hypothetical protein